MNNKYVISFDANRTKVILREHLEMEPGLIEFTYEESYEIEIIQNAMQTSKFDLITAFRTNNIYPTRFFAEKIADGIIELFSETTKETIEVVFNDKEAIATSEQEELLKR